MMLLLAAANQAQAGERIGIAAIVNDEIITTTDVGERRDLIMATTNIPPTVENQAKLTPRVVQSLIDETLQMQEAKRQSLTVTDEEVTKAIDNMGPTKDKAPGSLKQFIAEKGLSVKSLENQIRAQLAWSKVVQRKLRRNVTISQDEIHRAQLARAAAPGTTELRIAAISIPIESKQEEEAASKLAEEIAQELRDGKQLVTIAAEYADRKNIQINPPVWAPEDKLQPALLRVLKELKIGETTPPIRSQNSFQIIQLLDQQVMKKQDDDTEIALKEIDIPVPASRDKNFVGKLKATTTTLHTNYGNCMDTVLPATELPAKAVYVRAKIGALNSDQRTIINRLEVGDISEPLLAPDMVRLVVLCEKIEPPVGNLPNAETVKQELFAEKIELEAQKHMRNLRRDAFIDIKGEK